jgi:hypothetical protein
LTDSPKFRADCDRLIYNLLSGADEGNEKLWQLVTAIHDAACGLSYILVVFVLLPLESVTFVLLPNMFLWSCSLQSH